MDIKEYTQKILNAYSSFIKDKVLEKDIYASKENDGYVKKSEKAKTLECMEGMKPSNYIGSDINGNVGTFPLPTMETTPPSTSNNSQIVKLDVLAGEPCKISLENGEDITTSLVQCYDFKYGEEDVVQTLKVFNNSEKENFYFRKPYVSFDGGMQIKRSFVYPFSRNSNGFYESEVVDVSGFELIGEVGKSEEARLLNMPKSAIPPMATGNRVMLDIPHNNFHNGSSEDKTSILQDGSLREGSVGCGVIVLTNALSHFKFSTDRPIKLYGYGTPYKDSGGSSGKKVSIFREDGTFVCESQTADNEWKVLADKLDAGTYRFKVLDRVNNYVQFTELYAEEYKSPTYIIKEDGKYYSLKNYSNGSYQEISVGEVDSNLVFLDDLFREVTIDGETFRPIEKFTRPQIVCVEEVTSLTINGVKSLSELLMAANSFNTKVAEHIDYFNVEAETLNEGKVKLVVSKDYGKTWLTTSDFGATWKTLDNSVELKRYEEFTDEEVMNWNLLKEEINKKGISSDIIKNVNFNTLNSTQLRFAYCLSITSLEDVAINKSIKWQFDSLGKMKKMNDEEVEIQLTSDSIIITPYKDTKILKVNISNGSIG